MKTISSNSVLRQLAGLDSRDSFATVKIVPGDAPPRQVGRSYYWTTPSGKTEVRHPNAYKWPTQYHGSTRRVEVGRVWLAELVASAVAIDAYVEALRIC